MLRTACCRRSILRVNQHGAVARFRRSDIGNSSRWMMISPCHESLCHADSIIVTTSKIYAWETTTGTSRRFSSLGGRDEKEDDILNSSTTRKQQKMYFDPHKSSAEWRDLTGQLLLAAAPVVDATEDKQEEGLSWIRNGETNTGDTRSSPPLIVQAISWWSFQRSPEGVRQGFLLFEHLCRYIVEHPDDEATMNTTIHHWYTGRQPQSTHLLNAVLDSWRICRTHVVNNHRHQHDDNNNPQSALTSTLPTPVQMLKKVEDLASITDIPLNQRTYSLIMQAATASAAAAARGMQNSSRNNNLQKTREQHPRRRRRRKHRDQQSQDHCSHDDNNTIGLVETAPLFCEDILQRMLQRGETYPPALPDTIAFTTAMKAWAILAGSMQQLQLQSRFQRGQQGNARTIIESSLSPPQRALQLLTEMQQLYHDRVIDAQPNTITYNTLLEVLTNCGQVERAEEVLREKMMSNPISNALPDTESFRIVIFGWASYNSRQNAFEQSKLHRQQEGQGQRIAVDWFDHAYKLLQEMEDFHQDRQDPLLDSDHAPEVQVDASFYSRLISSLAKGRQYQRAENLYLEMQQRFGSILDEEDNSNEMTTTPPAQQQQQPLLRLHDDCRAKRAMIVIYANTNRPSEAEQVLKDLELLLEQQQEEEKGQWQQSSAIVALAPKASHYRDVIDSWATKASIEKTQQRRGIHDSNDGLDRGEQLLLRMMDKSMSGRVDLTPSIQLIDRVLCKWVDKRRGKDAKQSGCFRAETLLRLLEERLAVGAVGGQQQEKQNLVNVLREGRSLFFGRVIYAWSQSSILEAPERAESLLWEMQQHCDDLDARNSNEAMGPTRFHYCSVITAWGQSGRSDAAENAKDVFAIALDQYKIGHEVARPDTVLYLAVIHACARVGDANGVEQYIDKLLDECERDGNNKDSFVHMTTTTLNTILVAILHCSSKGQRCRISPEKAIQSFDRVKRLQVDPDAHSYKLLVEVLSLEKDTYASQIEVYLAQARKVPAAQ